MVHRHFKHVRMLHDYGKHFALIIALFFLKELSVDEIYWTNSF